jgi:hypothetical protein
MSLGRVIVALSLAGLMLFAVAGCGSNGPDDPFTGRRRPEGSKNRNFVVVKRSADGGYAMAWLTGRSNSGWLPMEGRGRALCGHIAAVKSEGAPRVPGYDIVLRHGPADDRLLYRENVVHDYELTKASDNTSLPHPQPSAFVLARAWGARNSPPPLAVAARITEAAQMSPTSSSEDDRSRR